MSPYVTENPISAIKYEREPAFSSAFLAHMFLGLLASKGIDPHLIGRRARHTSDSLDIGKAVHIFVNKTITRPYEDNHLKRAILKRIGSNDRHISGYSGSPEQNLEIDSAISQNRGESELRKFTGVGAHRSLFLSFYDVARRLSNTRINIIGAGASGLLAALSLSDIGYNNIQIIDQRPAAGGIWRDQRVAGLSKNNPFDIAVQGIRPVRAAPGPGSDIARFLAEVDYTLRRRGVRFVQGKVTSVEPGDLYHKLEFRSNNNTHTSISPILILASGTGSPLHPHSENHIKSDLRMVDAGHRWQELITYENALVLTKMTSPDRPLILQGLGNSTAEMMVQIHDLNQSYPEINIDFVVVTHYPKDAIYNPTNDVTGLDGKVYHLYRDIKKPNLVKLAGDLKKIDAAFTIARDQGRIITDIESSRLDGEKIVFTAKNGDEYRYDYDRQLLYTLIGYGQTKEFLESVGLGQSIRDPYSGSIHYDWDGELQRSPGELGRNRLYPGYFALGPILKSPENVNAPVIPGNIFRIYDLLFGINLRSEEARRRRTTNYTGKK